MFRLSLNEKLWPLVCSIMYKKSKVSSEVMSSQGKRDSPHFSMLGYIVEALEAERNNPSSFPFLGFRLSEDMWTTRPLHSLASRLLP